MALEEPFVEQLKQRKPSAYVILVERFEAPLYRFFLSGHRNHHLAEEQTAETFAQLVRTLPGMRGGIEQLRSYVFSTARHVQIHTMRKSRQPPVAISDADAASDPGHTPAKLADMREQVERVLKAIRQLDDPVGQVLLLRFVESLSIDEIAQVMQIPIGTIKSHIFRGKAQLKLVLSDKESVP